MADGADGHPARLARPVRQPRRERTAASYGPNAVAFALGCRLTGTYNLMAPGTPRTNRDLLDEIGRDLGFGPLEFRDELSAPARPVSGDRLTEAGFRPRGRA